ncbi:MAG TPA: MFS transporter, partial [Gaiellaceae bacterium]|nr:MFS transporter [Gaiellaceae bacterium]
MKTQTRRRRVLLAAMLIDTLGGGLLTPFELVYALKIAHLSLTSAGLVLSVAAAAGLALGPVAGAGVDRIGPARVVAVANGLGAAGCLILLLWTNVWGYSVGAFFLGTNMRVFWAAFTPLVASIAGGAELEQWFARLRAARYIGIVSGEGVSGLAFLAGVHTGLRLLVIANGVSFVAALVLVLAVAPRGAARAADEAAKPGVGGYRRVLRDRVNLLLAALNIAATLLLVTPILVLPVFVLDRLHLPSWLPGVLAGFLTATAGAGLLFGTRFVRGRRRLRNLEIAALLWALGCAVFLLAPIGIGLGYGALFLGALLLGLGEALYAPTADALPAALAPVELRGRYAALHQMAWGISESIAPTLGAAMLAAGNAALWLTLAGI